MGTTRRLEGPERVLAALGRELGALRAAVWARMAQHAGAADPHASYVRHALALAKGDLPAATGAGAFGRRAVGADGWALVGDSTHATGVGWAAQQERVRAARKTVAESVTSSTSMQNDDELLVAFEAGGAAYLLDAVVFYSASATGDIKFGLAVGAGTLGGRWSITSLDPAAGTTRLDSAAATATLTAGGDGTIRAAVIRGVIVPTAAANLRLQWAQNVSDVTATQVAPSSYLAAWRL